MFYVTGSLGSDPYLEGEPVLVSAGVAWNNPGSGFTMEVPDADPLFVDSGGYQIMAHFDGEYPFSIREYLDWADSIGADYVAGRDWICTPAEDLGDGGNEDSREALPTIPERINQTIEAQAEQAVLVDKGDWDFEFVPVLQGYSVDDYRYCARRLRDAGVARQFMGVGSTCSRDTTDKTRQIVEACHEELPGAQFHLFGATKSTFADRQLWGLFTSGDTNSWRWRKPDGSLTESKADNGPALEAYRNDVDETRSQMAAQSGLGEFAQQGPVEELIDAAKTGWKCGCGTVVPAFGTDFEPGCRGCEMAKLNRWADQLAALESAPQPTCLNRPEKGGLGSHTAESDKRVVGPDTAD
jgi:hypothetical protein